MHISQLEGSSTSLSHPDNAILPSLWSRMLTFVGPFFLISLLMVSMYLNFGLPLGLTHFTSMSSTVLVIWISAPRLNHTRVVDSASDVLLLAELLPLP